MLRAALRAFDSRDPAAAVAQLVDEACEGGARHLRFAGPGIGIDLGVAGAGRHLVMSVDLQPRFDCRVEVHHRGGGLHAQTAGGHCELAQIERGPVRVTVEGPEGDHPPRTQTTWVSL